jgi:hypothetical protein
MELQLELNGFMTRTCSNMPCKADIIIILNIVWTLLKAFDIIGKLFSFTFIRFNKFSSNTKGVTK